MPVLDTNVVSELRKVRPGKADPAVAHWADSVAAGSLSLCAITAMELDVGLLRV